MKLQTRELEAVIATIKAKQQAHNQLHRDEAWRTYRRFDHIAKVIFEYLIEFDFLLDIPVKHRTSPEVLAAYIREEMFEQTYIPDVIVKSTEQLRNEVVMAAPNCKTLDQIVATVNPFK
jgi:hypothetical protein